MVWSGACQLLVKGLSGGCQGLVISLSCREVVRGACRGLSCACQVPFRGLSDACQGLVRCLSCHELVTGLSGSCQELVKAARSLSGTCQVLVSSLSMAFQALVRDFSVLSGASQRLSRARQWLFMCLSAPCPGLVRRLSDACLVVL